MTGTETGLMQCRLTRWIVTSVPLPEQFLIGIAAGAAMQRLRPVALPVPRSAARPIGLIMISGGLGLILAGWLARGWWADLDHPEALVQSGPHRFTRNPMYVGMAMVHLGAAVAARSWWLVATWAPAMASTHRGIVTEEAALEAQFGPSYERYRQTVPRYLGPVH